MAFKFQWPVFSTEFHDFTQQQITLALNRITKPPNIHGDITVTELHFGQIPPQLVILGIDELSVDLTRTKSIYRLLYSGDSYIILSTHVQANPITLPLQHSTLAPSSYSLAAHIPLIVPMQIKISNINLNGIMSLVMDKEKGLTLTFKSDPLESIQVSSSFDNCENIKNLIQQQIETQIRGFFMTELPQIIHNISLDFIKNNSNDSLSSTTEIPDLPNYSDGRWHGNEYESENDLYIPATLEKFLYKEEFNGLGNLQDSSRTLPTKVLSRESLNIPIKSYSKLHSKSKSEKSNISENSGIRRRRTATGFRTLRLYNDSPRSTLTTTSLPIITVGMHEAYKVHQENETFTEPQILDPSKTHSGVHLLNLMTSNRSLSVLNSNIRNIVLRADPKSKPNDDEFKRRKSKVSPVKNGNMHASFSFSTAKTA